MTVRGKRSTYVKDVGDGALKGGGGGLGEVYKKTIRIEPNMMLVLPIKIIRVCSPSLLIQLDPVLRK